MTSDLKKRFTDSKRHRLFRPVAVTLGGILSGALISLATLSYMDSAEAVRSDHAAGDPVAVQDADSLSGRASPDAPARLAALSSPESANATATDASPAAAFEPQARDKTVSVGKGDTLIEVLTRAGADRGESHAAITALTKMFDPRRLKIGQEITLTFETFAGDGGESGSRLARVALDESVERQVSSVRTDDGSFQPKESIREFQSAMVRAGGVIEDSLFLAARRAGIPAATVVELIRIFSFDVDFQREIHPGDAFEVFFERFYDEEGRPVKDGVIRVASMTLSEQKLTLYRYTPSDDGIVDYYTDAGQSVKKTLMRTPVDGARLSSRFGKRKHPVLGYTKMHKGLDFAAPRGTPIMAAGDGVVEYAARNGSYGNYIRLRHNGTYKTAYAHLKGFARGIRKGKRVRQGQVIGYIGTTGRSTGPHLHYEVLVGGKQKNPLSIKLPTGRKLKGKELARFASHREDLDRQVAETTLNSTVAAIE